MQEDEIKDGDYLIPLLDIIPTLEEVHKFASIMLTQENKRIKLLTDEESEQALIEYKIACEEVGIKEADDLMDSIILAHTFYSIVDDRVYDPNNTDEFYGDEEDE